MAETRQKCSCPTIGHTPDCDAGEEATYWPDRPVAQLPADWIEVRRGFGSVEMSSLKSGEFLTASGLRDGGYIIWKKKVAEVSRG